MRLPLTIIMTLIITITHCVSVPMPAPITCWASAQSRPGSTQCQRVSTAINSVSSWLPLPTSSDKVRPDKSPTKVRVALIHQEKWLLCCLWHRSRIRAHNKLCEAVKLLGLSQYIFLFTMHQSSSSKSHYKAEIDENPVWPEFWTSQVFRLFFVIAYMKQQTLCCKLLWNRKERQKKKTQASS